MSHIVVCADACSVARAGALGHVLICDPPYSEHVHNKAVSQSIGGGVRERDLGFDCLTPELRAVIARQAALVPRWTVIYSDIEGLADWRSALDLEAAEHGSGGYLRALPWVRWSMPQLSGDRPPSGCEMLTIAWGSQGGRKSWNGPGNLINLDHKCLRGEDKHKTEKPLDQLLDLVSWFSEPQELVVDLTAGRGTTGLACRMLGRNFLGFDVDQDEVEKANARILSKLSERDEERFARWKESQAQRQIENVRITANTAKYRAALEAKRAARKVAQ